MGVFARGSRLWLRVKDTRGTWINRRTPYVVGQEEQAERLYRTAMREIESRRSAGLIGQVTVQSYFDKWIKERKEIGLRSVGDDESRLKKHAMPKLGALLLTEVRPRDVRQLVLDLRRTDLAPRTIRHIYFALAGMFKAAEAEELIIRAPVALARGTLPGKIDKDPAWRQSAIFTREEVELVISQPEVPEDRRVLYSLLFLAGVRFGEAAALRWRNYDPVVKPLGKLGVAASYNVKLKKETRTKTEMPREIPVHGTLAAILAEWRLGGWVTMMGRRPQADDLLIPSREGNNRWVNHGLKRFHEDLGRLGIRPRRQHDGRRTFISLARTDGARKDLLEVVTHGKSSDTVDQYTTYGWPALCDEVAKLKIFRRDGKVLRMEGFAGPVNASKSLVTSSLHPSEALGSIQEK